MLDRSSIFSLIVGTSLSFFGSWLALNTSLNWSLALVGGAVVCLTLMTLFTRQHLEL